ncbi:MAG: hypothetical protein AB7F25_12890 [Deferribacterales bacterium]
MSNDTIKQDVKEIVLSRLVLSQQLLEESDNLPGKSAYDFDNEKWWFHPRHEREALVVYLLLTCFDKLGQHKGFITVENWLNSKKNIYVEQKNKVINQLPKECGVIDSAIKLFKKYNELYGVKNAFFQGINNLSESLKEKLLNSIILTYNPEFGKYENTSTPSYPLDDKDEEQRLKLEYLYGKRNRFTHKLDQYHTSSFPLMSHNKFENESSWIAWIKNSKLQYVTTHQEHVKCESKEGANVFTIQDWPFILFEVLYSALGISFDRTTIKLKFQVQVESTNGSYITYYSCVEHNDLKDVKLFLKNVNYKEE